MNSQDCSDGFCAGCGRMLLFTSLDLRNEHFRDQNQSFSECGISQPGYTILTVESRTINYTIPKATWNLTETEKVRIDVAFGIVYDASDPRVHLHHILYRKLHGT